MKVNKPKESDKHDLIKAIELLTEVRILNPSIDVDIWVTAFIDLIARSFRAGDCTYEDFCREMDKVKSFYGKLWE